MGKILKIIFFNGFAVATRGGLWRGKGQGAGGCPSPWKTGSNCTECIARGDYQLRSALATKHI